MFEPVWGSVVSQDRVGLTILCKYLKRKTAPMGKQELLPPAELVCIKSLREPRQLLEVTSKAIAADLERYFVPF